MAAVQIICSLEDELRICRYVSFVELVELLKFGHMHFEHANGFQRGRLLAAAATWRRLPGRPGSDGTSAAKQARRRNRLLGAWPDARLSFQTWTVLGQADAHWGACSSPDEKIGIVSSARRVAESLLVGSNTTVVIGKADELDFQADDACSSRSGLTGSPAPQLPPANVGIIASSTDANAGASQDRGLRLQAILSTLLTNVIVAPYATERFLDLVARLVGENTGATVTRANELSFAGMRSVISRAYAPAFASTESARYGLHEARAS